MTRLGQHFLKNSAAIKKVIHTLELKAGDEILEIGPGHGELTVPLGNAAKALDVKITAIERDLALAEALRPKLNENQLEKSIKIVQGDALKLLTIETEKLKPGYKLIGNIPYYITGKLLRTIGELPQKPALTVLMIQKEVAERIAATPGEMNRLAAAIQIWAEPKLLMIVPKKDFSPPPEVDSALILLTAKEPLPQKAIEKYEKMLKFIFAQPRKTLLNNLRSGIGEKMKREEAEKALLSLEINPDLRPQDLSIEKIVALSELFF